MPVDQADFSALQAAWLAAQPDQPGCPEMALNSCGIGFDCSTVLPSQHTAGLLLKAAREAGLSDQINRLFSGKMVNLSENQAALHMLLRDPQASADLDNLNPTAILQARTHMLALADDLRQGRMPDGAPITDILHLGIGGSVLSPRLLLNALGDSQPGMPDIHFLSAPASQWSTLAAQLDPATTLVIAASKSFTTVETLHNLKLVDNWSGGRGQRLAITANPSEAARYGFASGQILPLWPWVGGRFAFSSAVSLVAAISMGSSAFRKLLRGAHAMDQHFRSAELEHNLPVWMALTDFWLHVVGDHPGRGVFSYDPRLSLLTAWLQQLETESNGKSVSQTGELLQCRGAPLVFGGDGSDAQHALFQMLHQGQACWPLELVGVRPGRAEATSQLLFAQLLGQAQTFRQGDQDAPPHQRLPGNRPVVTTLLDRLDAECLGALLAAYEHKTVCFAHLVGCNPFDQWGVAAGKQATQAALRQLELKHDA